MTSKFLWIICGFIVVGATAYFVYENHSNKKVSGARIFNYSKVNPPKVNKLPIKSKDASDPRILAKSVYLIDYDTLYVLYENKADEKVPIASTTKIATALVVLENYKDKLDDVVTITPKMIAVEGSDIQLRTGEKITVNNLLNGLLIMSGNDAANALAEYFSGKEGFVNEMNAKVREIGALNTEYQDPAGLDDKGYSTAEDLALISVYSLKNKKFADIVSTSEITISSSDGRIVHELKNSNRMLREEEQYYYPNASGVKTGFTNEAGHVLVSCAEKDGHKILAVVLNTQENTLVASAKESKKLLEWGFANWTW